VEYKIFEIEVRQDFTTVFKQDIKIYEDESITITEIPPGVLSSNYNICQIFIKRKGEGS
jgi:hypothetical protein